jgi:uncharacterized protein (DUF2141 family)
MSMQERSETAVGNCEHPATRRSSRRAWCLLILLLGIPLATSARAAGNEATAKLVIEVTGFRNDNGQLLMRLFNGPDGYPKDDTKAIRRLKQKIEGRRAVVEIRGLPFGAYAIGCVHDENGDGTLNRNFVGIPKEGTGASNDARGRRGPPKWEDARFDFKSDGSTIRIHVLYP